MVMNYGYLEPVKPKQKPDIWLCKPDLNRTSVYKIKDSYGETYSNEFSAINEFSFTIPVLIERNHQLIQNPLVDKIKDRFLIKTKNENGNIEYFIILKINKKMDNDGFESITYQCYNQGIQLANKLIRDEEYTSKNLSFIANEILASSTWKLDYVDVDFDLKYRYYEVSSSNALQCIFDLAELFNASIVFNSLLKTISFYKHENVGKNKGLMLKEGKYLESFDLSIDPNSMVTRLKVYGQDGLEFRRLSPTGSNYIEDYSFFIYPFEADDSYNVIKKSNYWSDELCIAYKKYQKKLESVQGQFETLTTQATTTRDSIQQKEQELSVLQAQLTDLKNQRDVINDTYGENAPSRTDWQEVINKINAKNTEITNKQSEINTLKTQLENINTQLTNLGESVKVENNFTQAEIEEWEFYIIEKEYYNESITDDEDLLAEAIEVFEETRQPPIDLTLSMDNFLSSFDYNFDKDKLSIGDTLRLKSRDLNINVKAKITNLTFDYDSGDIQVTVSNTTRESDDFSKFIEKLNLATNTSTTVNIDKFGWNKGEEAKSELEDYINGNLDSAKQLITGGMNNSVTLSERGLIARDLTDPDKTWLFIQNGQLFITADGGNKVEVAINKNGCIKERVYKNKITKSLEVEL